MTIGVMQVCDFGWHARHVFVISPISHTELELQHKDDCKTIEIDEECDSDDQPLLAHRGSPWKQQQNNDTPFQPVSAKASMHHAPLDDGSKDSVLVLVEEVVCEQDRLPWYRMPQVYVALGGYGLIACTYSFLDEVC